MKKKLGLFLNEELLGEVQPAEVSNAFHFEGKYLGIINGKLTFETYLGILEVEVKDLPEEMKELAVGTVVELKGGW